MELLNLEEIKTIVKPFGSPEVVNWSIENYSDELIGYLGDHIRLNIQVKSGHGIQELKLFVKSMPRFDLWKAKYLKELNFFKKEYVMLSDLFQQFDNRKGVKKWRPQLIYLKEDLFVFEDVAELGYEMPSHRRMMSYEQIIATVETIGRFHAQSFIYEEKKSRELKRPYRIWEEYSECLREPTQNLDWRNAGRNAVIDYLKVYSTRTNISNFAKGLEVVIPMLFNGAMVLMTPSSMYRNVVVHRDLWSNNIFFKRQENEKLHALIVDFQTVLYASPLLDISVLLFINTSRQFREEHINDVLNVYYDVLSNELKSAEIDIDTVFDKSYLDKAYEESIMFGITQAALILPITFMDGKRREELFSNPENAARINNVSRSNEFIQIAKEDENYRIAITELFDEIVDRYMHA